VLPKGGALVAGYIVLGFRKDVDADSDSDSDADADADSELWSRKFAI
jgi:hypothetical protein